MPRLVGLGYASKLYRDIPGLAAAFSQFTTDGNEVAFGTIGNAASCAEGMFWEAVNAIGVLGGPVVISIWDDEYGISVPNEFQITKGDLSAVLSGFARDASDASGKGFDIYRVRGWDYPALLQAFADATDKARREHVPAILHVVELTQPQGHSTSGSHERYKSAERLEWERQNDGLTRLRALILERGWADEHRLAEIETQALEAARTAQRRAWELYLGPIERETEEAAKAIENTGHALKGDGRASGDELLEIAGKLRKTPAPLRRHSATALHEALFAAREAPADLFAAARPPPPRSRCREPPLLRPGPLLREGAGSAFRCRWWRRNTPTTRRSSTASRCSAPISTPSSPAGPT